MFAVPPAHAAQFESQHGSVSTVTQLCPSAQPALGTQSAASKQPAVKGEGSTHAGTSQRQLPAPAQAGADVKTEHGGSTGQGGATTDHVPPAVHCAVGPQLFWPP